MRVTIEGTNYCVNTITTKLKSALDRMGEGYLLHNDSTGCPGTKARAFFSVDNEFLNVCDVLVDARVDVTIIRETPDTRFTTRSPRGTRAFTTDILMLDVPEQMLDFEDSESYQERMADLGISV